MTVVKTIEKSLLDIHPRELKGIIKDIPTLPVIYQELFRMMQDPNVSVPELAETIARDQSLSTKILHLVNSAFYGYNKQVKTISRAVVILGFQAVRSAALATSVFDYFGDEESGGIDMTKFWQHSIASASICKELAAKTAVNQQEEAFLVGLLHDVGKLIIKRYFAADFDSVVKVAREQQLSWYDTEKALFQINHTTIARSVFRAWDFPPSVVEAVFCHHNPTSSSQHPQLAALAHTGNVLAYELGYGAPGGHAEVDFDDEALKILDIDVDYLDDFKDNITTEIDQTMEIIKLVE